MMHVVEINGIERLAPYRDEWTKLLAETPEASFLQTLDWFTIYWRHFGQDQRLRTLLVYDDQRLVGILPLAVKTMATRGGAVRTLSYPLDGWGTRYTPIGRDLRAVLTAALHHVEAGARDWDVLELDWTPRGCFESVSDAFAEIRVRPQIAARNDISLIDLSLDWEEYWMSLDGKHRSNVRRAEKKPAQLGEVELLHYRPDLCGEPDPRWDLYETCEQIAGRSWQGSSTTGNTLTHERVRQFLRDVHDAATRLGAVSIYLLSIGGEPAAFSYNYAFQGTEFGLRMGYDPRFKSVSAGNVLMSRMLQHAFAGQQRQFDMGEGESSYKRAWRTAAIPTYRFSRYATTSLRAQALRWKRHWSGERIAN